MAASTFPTLPYGGGGGGNTQAYAGWNQSWKEDEGEYDSNDDDFADDGVDFEDVKEYTLPQANEQIH